MAPEDLEQASRAELIDLVVEAHEQREQLEHQLRWFKKQLFGEKSERRIDLTADPSQLSLGEAFPSNAAPDEKTGVVRSHTRRERTSREEDQESGLRFDDSVPIKRIEIPNPELEGLAEDELTLIDERVTHQLAQQPADITCRSPANING